MNTLKLTSSLLFNHVRVICLSIQNSHLRRILLLFKCIHTWGFIKIIVVLLVLPLGVGIRGVGAKYTNGELCWQLAFCHYYCCQLSTNIYNVGALKCAQTGFLSQDPIHTKFNLVYRPYINLTQIDYCSLAY